VLNSSADLHLNFLVHLFSQPILVAHDNKETDSKESSKNQDEKHHTDHDFVGRSPVVLDASLTFLETQFSTNGRLEIVLAVDFQLLNKKNRTISLLSSMIG